MADYKAIKGQTIQNRTSDPLVAGVANGSWASGGNLNTDRWNLAGAGIQTAAIAIDGQNPNVTDVVEQYNGTSWTEVAENNTGRNDGEAGGTSTATIFFGGYTGTAASADAESWNGTAWTEGTNMNTARFELGGAGQTNTAVLAFGGSSPPRTGATEIWNGSTWTESGDLSVATKHIDGTGTSTAGVAVGGNNPGNSIVADVETFNGTAWSEIAEINTARFQISASGTTTSTLVFGGMTSSTGSTANTESYDGSSWTEVADLSTGRGFAGSISGGSVASSAIFGGTTDGGTPNDTAATEEWSAPATFRQLDSGDIYFNADPSSSVIKYVGFGTGAWASGGSANTARGNGFSFGSQTAGIFASGYTGSNVDNVENYNGSSWTEIAEVNSARREGAGFGTSTAGLVFGGRPPVTTNTESWNGSSWTETADLNLARADSHVRAGTSTDGIYSGGADGSPASETYLVVQTEKWDGSSWTEVGDMNTGREAGGNAGTSSSYALAVGGNPPSPGAVVESWNGTSWTEVGDLNTARSWCTGSGGSNTDSINFGGRTPGGSNENKTESWNGSSWTEVADMATGRYTHGSSSNGTTKAGLCIMGNTGTYITNTEEWTVPEALKTLASTNA